jgi:hypothetical protein
MIVTEPETLQCSHGHVMNSSGHRGNENKIIQPPTGDRRCPRRKQMKKKKMIQQEIPFAMTMPIYTGVIPKEDFGDSFGKK